MLQIKTIYRRKVHLGGLIVSEIYDINKETFNLGKNNTYIASKE